MQTQNGLDYLFNLYKQKKKMVFFRIKLNHIKFYKYLTALFHTICIQDYSNYIIIINYYGMC